jgi:hypothetical protein
MRGWLAQMLRAICDFYITICLINFGVNNPAMTHTFRIKETAKSKSLIEHLQTLSYVEHVEAPARKVLSEAEMIAKVKLAEKSKKIKWADAKKIIEKW